MPYIHFFRSVGQGLLGPGQIMNTTNEYKEQVKSRVTSKNFFFNFYPWKNGHPILLSLWSVTCSSLVQDDMSRGIHNVI